MSFNQLRSIAVHSKPFSRCYEASVRLLHGLGASAYDFISLRTFFSRFWWALFFLSMLGAVVYVLVVAHVWTRFVHMRAQHGSWRVAANLAEELQPQLDPLQPAETLSERLQYFNRINPVIDVYLYEPEQGVLFSGNGWRAERIDLGPIEKFLSFRGRLHEPIEIDTLQLEGPSTEQERSFSAARVSIDGRPGYLIAVLAGKRYQEATRVNRPGNLVMLGYSLIGSVILVPSVLSLLVVVLLTRRFKRMLKVVEAFQEGDYRQRVDDRSLDELGVYARAFDQMADTIVENMKSMQRQDEIRRELVANVSHELRRPLSLMTLSLETLRKGNAEWPPQQRSAYIEQTIDGCDQMARLVADLFELSKLDAVEAPPTLEACDLSEIAEDVAANFQKLAEAGSITLKVLDPVGVRETLADAQLITRALSNLVENALHNTRPGGTVEIALTDAGGAVRIEVRDNGRGIDPEEQAHIFERFYRGDKDRGGDATGAGLGLAIVRRIVEMHGDSIKVKSEPGKGSCFSFNLAHAA